MPGGYAARGGVMGLGGEDVGMGEKVFVRDGEVHEG